MLTGFHNAVQLFDSECRFSAIIQFIPVFQNVDGCSMHAGRLPGVLGGRTQCTPDPAAKLSGFFLRVGAFHGLSPDLDDLVQGFASAPVRILRHLLERMRHGISGPPIK
jgi:hypothetical protein